MKRFIYLSILVVIIAALLYAQSAVTVTQVPQSQLSGEVTATGSIWITLPDGTPRQALIETEAWVLILPAPGSGAPPILRPKLPEVPVISIIPRTGIQIPPSGNMDGREYQLAETFVLGTMILYRNGLRQTEGIDYSVLDFQTIIFVPHYTNDTEALVVADYTHDPDA